MFVRDKAIFFDNFLVGMYYMNNKKRHALPMVKFIDRLKIFQRHVF